MIADPVAAVPSVPEDPASAYVAARAASISGDHAGAAEIYAGLAETSADNDLRQRAIAEAISAGDVTLALRLIKQMPPDRLTIDSKLLVVADALRRGDNAQAVQLLGKSGPGADLSFWVPLVEAWSAAERRDAARALAILNAVPQSSAFSPFTDEQAALILLKLGRTAEAAAFAERAIGKAGAREYRVRFALAAGFAAAGDQARARTMIDGLSGSTAALRQSLDNGSFKRAAVDTAAEAFAEQLIALALEMRRAPGGMGAPVNIIQVARYAAPENSAAAILLGSVLAERDRLPEALAVYRSVDEKDPLKPEARDLEARALTEAERFDEALAIASAAARAPAPSSDDFARLGDIYSSMKRYNDAAAAYGEAVSRARDMEPAQRWPLLLLQANALERAGRWPEAKAALSSALALAPNEPLVLNFLGYAKLEHGEELDLAEALIRKASELAPDDASITDSLGWALYKRGRIEEAIDVLQKAATGDPAQSEIHEHLGDALYTAGRHFEARYAWKAALATAEEEDTARLKRKIETGLTRETAAP